jgi:hypothetical protein
MRYKLTVLMFVVCLGVNAQSYVPFPTDSAIWRVSFFTAQQGCPGLAAEYHYEITGDTTISSITYKKINRIGYTLDIFCYYGPFGYVGAIREDTNKRIYLCLPNSSTDTLLYDFNLNVGDTVRSYLNYFGGYPLVGSIDSILIGSSYRKRFNLYYPPSGSGPSIIEGIGSTHGLLDWNPEFEASGNLDCFKLYNQTLYPDTTTTCNMLVTGAPLPPPKSNITIFPTPSTGQITVTLPTSGFGKTIYYSLTDISGRIMRSEQITTIDGAIIIDRKELTDGVYLLTITIDSACFQEKIIFAED